MRNQTVRQMTMLALTVGLLLRPLMSYATDGVTLIDPGNLSSTSPGFLVMISTPGVYVLKGNLIVPDADTTAIEINADNVTIDLNGFAIQGPAQCSAVPVSCSRTGTGNGVHVVNRDNIVVTNGRIQGMGNLGVYLETRSVRLQHLNLISNGRGGAAFFGGLISDSVVEANGSGGIFGLDIVVRDNLIRNNQRFGLEAYGRSTYVNNSFRANNNGGAQVNGKPVQTGSNLCNESNCP